MGLRMQTKLYIIKVTSYVNTIVCRYFRPCLVCLNGISRSYSGFINYIEEVQKSKREYNPRKNKCNSY